MKKSSEKHIKKADRRSFFHTALESFLSTLIAIISVALFLLYGPVDYFRDLLVTSAMTTMNHHWIAELFYSDDTIDAIMKKNTIIESGEATDPDQIRIRSKMKNDYELTEVRGDRFVGWMIKIKDPSKVRVGTSKYLGTVGQKVSKIVEEYNATFGVNAGGFFDANGKGNGGTPMGCIVEGGQLVWGERGKKYGIIGFDKKNILILGEYTYEEMVDLGIRDAVEFRPYLIVNGKPSIAKGNGGWGIAPRTAIGQTKDGEILFLVIDGRQAHSAGATLKQVQDLMIEYGAYNAANLDGGSSSVMIVQNKLINSPSGPSGERKVPSAFIADLKPPKQ